MSGTVAHLDFETRSTVDLKKAGVYRYAEHPTTDVLCMSWRVGDGPVFRWSAGDPPPMELLAHVEAGGEVAAHNAGFERTIWNAVMHVRHGWPRLSIDQQDCTMARAMALALPGGLDQLSTALKTATTKDKDGHRLMMQMCKPRRYEPDGSPVWWDDADRLARLGRYCDQDVETETLVDQALPKLTPYEKEVWRLDQRINERGVRIDVAFAEKALQVVAEARKRADDRMWWLTDGEVKKCTEAARIVAWLNARGVPATSIAKGEQEEIILSAQTLGDSTAEEVVELRRAASKTSTDKFKAMLASVNADGRVRGALMYCGASTGRWAGKIYQPHNLPRVDEERDLPDVQRVLDLMESPLNPAEVTDAIELVTGRAPLDMLSKCLRATLMADPGKKLVGGDFSNIEGRVLAWFSGEAWKLDAFRAYDAGHGPDLYKLSYARSFGVDVDTVSKRLRQIGKVQELACGYQGGVGAYVSMGATLGVKAGDIAAVARAAATGEEWNGVGFTFSDEESRGLPREVWTGVKLVVNGWRGAHPNTVQGWWDLQDAAIEAVSAPGCTTTGYGGKVKYLAANGFLFCRLPSGRVLAYAAPRLAKTERNGRERWTVQFEGTDSKTKRWGVQSLYGGLQCENIVQAAARDLLVHAMFETEAAGLPIVLHVHDELVAETPAAPARAGLDAALLNDCMSRLPAWAEGLPVATATWEDTRYVK